MTPITINWELHGSIRLSMTQQHRTKRWTYYTLNVPAELEIPPPSQTDEERILAYVREHGSIRRAECQQLLGVSATRTGTYCRSYGKEDSCNSGELVKEHDILRRKWQYLDNVCP